MLSPATSPTDVGFGLTPADDSGAAVGVGVTVKTTLDGSDSVPKTSPADTAIVVAAKTAAEVVKLFSELWDSGEALDTVR